MNVDYVIFITRETMWTAVYILAPILGAGLVVGLVVSIFQAITQIHEMTLTFIPKMVVIGLIILIFMPWFMEVLITYTQEIFNQIPLMTQ